MYLQNKYTRIYFAIIERAKSRVLDCYKESHHIIPKSLGGSNYKENLVDLTAREHFICHLLLVKMTSGVQKRKMSLALWALSNMNKTGSRYKTTSKMFQFVREQYVASLTGRSLPDTVKEKIRSSNTGRLQSEATKLKRSEARLGSSHSDETKSKMSQSAKLRWSHIEDDSERIRKIKEARVKQVIVTIQVTCPHCGKEGGNRIMPRYHFDNCKSNPNVIK